MYVQRDVSSNTRNCVGNSRTIRPTGALVHTTAGGNSLAWLQGGSCDAGAPASADYLISRTGERFNLCKPGWYAYHAGQSKVTIRDVVYTDNEVSQVLIGIELESLNSQLITREQYFSLAELLNERQLHYSWPGDYPIYGHYAVARPLGRRSDPTNFDWGVLFAILAGK